MGEGGPGRGCCLSQGPVAGTSESSTIWEMGMAGREGILDMVHVGLGGQGRTLGPEVPVSAVRCLLLERGGWVRNVFLTPHPCKNIPVLVEVFHSARVIAVSRDHCLLREQMVFPSHSPRR